MFTKFGMRLSFDYLRDISFLRNEFTVKVFVYQLIHNRVVLKEYQNLH
jgi:hypothetical protein